MDKLIEKCLLTQIFEAGSDDFAWDILVGKTIPYEDEHDLYAKISVHFTKLCLERLRAQLTKAIPIIRADERERIREVQQEIESWIFASIKEQEMKHPKINLSAMRSLVKLFEEALKEGGN